MLTSLAMPGNFAGGNALRATLPWPEQVDVKYQRGEPHMAFRMTSIALGAAIGLLAGATAQAQSTPPATPPAAAAPAATPAPAEKPAMKKPMRMAKAKPMARTSASAQDPAVDKLNDQSLAAAQAGKTPTITK
jgi:hypothetical protein